MYRFLSEEVYPRWPCALIHSRLEEEEKAGRMARFVSGDCRVLVATSVVEVGVDVPSATCMVVEHADRFGLSALHQLRGRVGRSDRQSYAFLVYSRELTEAALERLRVMKETTDGFRIADEDLRIRGPGALLGVEQAGYLRLGVADLAADMQMVAETRAALRRLLERDRTLERPEHEVLRRVVEAGPWKRSDGG
jgi:ATP-dependent DNA helicase RecG